jgi:hypothetical protein
MNKRVTTNSLSREAGRVGVGVATPETVGS